MKPVKKPNLSAKKPSSVGDGIKVSLHVVSEKERQGARISTYAYLMP